MKQQSWEAFQSIKLDAERPVFFSKVSPDFVKLHQLNTKSFYELTQIFM